MKRCIRQCVKGTKDICRSCAIIPFFLLKSLPYTSMSNQATLELIMLILVYEACCLLLFCVCHLIDKGLDLTDSPDLPHHTETGNSFSQSYSFSPPRTYHFGETPYVSNHRNTSFEKNNSLLVKHYKTYFTGVFNFGESNLAEDIQGEYADYKNRRSSHMIKALIKPSSCNLANHLSSHHEHLRSHITNKNLRLFMMSVIKEAFVVDPPEDKKLYEDMISDLQNLVNTQNETEDRPSLRVC